MAATEENSVDVPLASCFSSKMRYLWAWPQQSRVVSPYSRLRFSATQKATRRCPHDETRRLRRTGTTWRRAATRAHACPRASARGSQTRRASPRVQTAGAPAHCCIAASRSRMREAQTLTI
eukprot:1527786-Pleurochrysis_carterae.AAC.2